MIERELYLKRIRPFIDTDMVKVMTGMRRSGKSIMLELIKGELLKRGVKPCQLVSLNFEDMCYIPLLTAATLYNELINRAQSFSGKAYFFLDEIQKCLLLGQGQSVAFGRFVLVGGFNGRQDTIRGFTRMYSSSTATAKT